MISLVEIREKARENEVPESTIERDYAQNWFLKSLFTGSENFLLKGGTGIRKAHVPGYRFSDDLDFGLLEKTGEEDLKSTIVEATMRARGETGIDFDTSVKMKENLNGYEGTVYFRILRKSGHPLRIKLDITEYNRELLVLPLQKKPIIHNYSDDCNAHLFVYSLEEILAEKIRAIFERVRPRDLYDIWYLMGSVDNETVVTTARRKCSFKRVEMDIQLLARRKDFFGSAWHNSLVHQVKELPEFDETFNRVMTMLKDIANQR